jgi:hypothetical protein
VAVEMGSFYQHQEKGATAVKPPDPVLALVEAHKAVWARLLETKDRTDDYETLEEAGRAADTALDAIMKTR